MKKKAKEILVAVVLILVFLVGCSTNVAEEKKDSNTQNKETATIDKQEIETLKYGITPGTIRTAIVLLADHLGYFEEEGVDVEFVDISDAPAALTSISANKGEVDIWGTGIVPGLNFIANGSDLTIFAGTAAEGGAIIAKNEDIDAYKDLSAYENIKIATVRADTAWVTGREVLKEKGIDVDSIEVIEVDGQVAVAQAIAKGEATLGFLPTEFAKKFEDLGVGIVYEVGELAPLYVCCRQITSTALLEEKEDAFVNFLTASLRASEYYEDEANRAEIIQFLADYSNQTEEYVNEYLFENRTIMTVDPNKNGIDTYYSSLVDAGYFDGDVDINEHVDTNVYKQALNRVVQKEPENPFYQSLVTIYNQNNS
ncbi:ABC transporter substrate-binding protein [Enterococcus olivae]